MSNNPGGGADEQVVIEYFVKTEDAVEKVRQLRAEQEKIKKQLQEMKQQIGGTYKELSKGLTDAIKESAGVDTEKKASLKAISGAVQELTAQEKELAKAAEKSRKEAEKGQTAWQQYGKAIMYALGLSIYSIISNTINAVKQLIQTAVEYGQALTTLAVSTRALQRVGSQITFKQVIQEVKDLKAMFPIFTTKEAVEAVGFTQLVTRNFQFTNEQMAQTTRIAAGLSVLLGKDLQVASRELALFLSSGYAESMQRAGFAVNRLTVVEEAHRLGIEKSYMAMTEQERARAALSLISRQFATVEADINDIMDQQYYKLKITQKAWEEFTNSLSLRFLPVLAFVSEGVKTLVGLIAVLTNSLVTAYTAMGKEAQLALDSFANPKKFLEGQKKILEEMATDFTNAIKSFFPGEGQELVLPMGDYKGKPFAGMEMSAEEASDQVTTIVDQMYQELSSMDEQFKIDMKNADEQYQQDIYKIEEDGRRKSLEMMLDHFRKEYENYIDHSRQHEELELEHSRKMEEIQKDSEQKLSELNLEYNQDKIDLATEYARKLEELQRDSVRDFSELEIKYNQDQIDIINEYNNRVSEINNEAREKELKEENDLQEKLLRLREDFMLDLEDAVRERDARAIMKAARKYNLEKQQLEREHQETRTTNETEIAKEIENLAKAREEKLAQLALEYQRRQEELQRQLAWEIEQETLKYSQEQTDLANHLKERQDEITRQSAWEIEQANLKYQQELLDLETHLAQQKEDLDRDYQQRQSDLAAQLEQEKTDRTTRWEQDKLDLQTRFDERFQMYVDDMTRTKQITAEGLDQIAKEYEAVYGPDGRVETAIKNALVWAAIASAVTGYSGSYSGSENAGSWGEATTEPWSGQGTYMPTVPGTPTTPTAPSTSGGWETALGGGLNGSFQIDVVLSPDLEANIIQETQNQIANLIVKTTVKKSAR